MATSSCNYYDVYISTAILDVSDLCHGPFKYLILSIMLVYDPAKAFITVSAIITVEGLAGGRKWQASLFRCRHICMLIDVILLSPCCPLLAVPPAQRLATEPPSRL